MSLVVAENLQFGYGNRSVLRRVSIHLEPGQVVALLGPNGSGKSTLLRVLLGQLAGSGAVKWEGRDVAAWPRRQFARRVAYLPQSPIVDDEQRVIDVLRMGRAPYWGAFGIESQRDVDVAGAVADQLGLQELLARPMGELSGGQQQRVFIARCLVQEPAALLLDEPSTFLDLRHQVELAQLLRTLAREQHLAVLMASHDLNLAASSADRMLLLHDGILAAEGPPAQVLDADLLGRVYGVPMRRVDVPGMPVPFVLPLLPAS